MVPGAQKRIRQSVESWGASAGPHRFGGLEFRLGPREVGHIHGDSLVDIPFPKLVRDEVIQAGLAEPHHVLPESGWISLCLREAADVDRALDLLRRSFDLAVEHRRRTYGVPAAH